MTESLPVHLDGTNPTTAENVPGGGTGDSANQVIDPNNNEEMQDEELEEDEEEQDEEIYGESPVSPIELSSGAVSVRGKDAVPLARLSDTRGFSLGLPIALEVTAKEVVACARQ
jgi:hypothetical protein